MTALSIAGSGQMYHRHMASGGNSFHVTRQKTPCSGLAENGRPDTREPAVQWAEIERKAIERDT